jgi:hypothetical protein
VSHLLKLISSSMITVGAEAGHAGVVVGGDSAGVDVIGNGWTLLVVVQVLSV